MEEAGIGAAGFRHSSDILQIGAIRSYILKGQQTGCYLKYLQPTAPIPASSTAVHQYARAWGKTLQKVERWFTE